MLEKESDLIIVNPKTLRFNSKGELGVQVSVNTDRLFDFIRELLTRRDETLLREIERIKAYDKTNICDCGREVEFAGWGFNDALSKVQEIIKSRLTKKESEK